ncbi:hypothetical protein [Flavobacterium sp.]|jgi:hypothetical protein|uniref:hypothetical protein n=1 Tax=Flavobacterium sp. TaxID=239 RepID=UPI002A8128E7|nr:hypothetical protein [Flavobacterium sp.]
MKKIYFIYLTCFIATNSFCQVGIKTTNPQEELHIAGPTSTIRVEGLNSPNDVNNLGVGSTTPVYANANGDLVLGTLTDNVQILFDSEDYLMNVQDPTNLVNQTGGGAGFTQAGIPIGGVATSFTLTKPAIVEINYAVTWTVGKNVAPNSRIDDFRARIVQTAMYFRRNNYMGVAVINDYYGNPINGGPWCITSNCSELGGLLGINGQFYNNVSDRNGEWKSYRNTASDYVVLGPGTYTPMFACQLAVGDTAGTGAVKLYLGGEKDEVQIIAYYFN